MDLTPLPIDVPPGIVKVDSPFAAKGRWIDCNHVRFVKNRPQKIGGVQKLDLEIADFTGIARGARAWANYAGTQNLVFGTACNLYLYRTADLTDITPNRTDANSISLTNPFTTTNASAIVTVADASHGIEAAGTRVTFSGASAVGGITIDGDYTVTSIIDSDSYTITHSSSATSAATGGGTVTAEYALNCGDVDPGYLRGWGISGWGEGGWGTPASLAESLISEPLVWTFSEYGEDLLCNPLNGGLYMYDSSAGTGKPALIANAPTEVRSSFVTSERYLFALGCDDLGGNFDAMTVRWPDVDDYTDWTPSSTNTSNQRKLQGGTRLMAGAPLLEGLQAVWSNSALFIFQFTGANEVYASRKVADDCGLIAPLAKTVIGGVAYWMTGDNFMMYAGSVDQIPNSDDIREYVFNDINREHIFKSFAFYNPLYGEVWFMYPSAGSTECDRYAMVNVRQWSWSIGTWSRSTSARYQTGENRPVLFGLTGKIFIHDVAENPDDDGAALSAHIELAPTDIGRRHFDVYGFLPDFETHAGDIELYMYGMDYPNDTQFDTDTQTIEEGDTMVEPRIGARMFGMKLTSNTIGGDFRLGRPQIVVDSAGERL